MRKILAFLVMLHSPVHAELAQTSLGEYIKNRHDFFLQGEVSEIRLTSNIHPNRNNIEDYVTIRKFDRHGLMIEQQSNELNLQPLKIKTKGRRITEIIYIPNKKNPVLGSPFSPKKHNTIQILKWDEQDRITQVMEKSEDPTIVLFHYKDNQIISERYSKQNNVISKNQTTVYIKSSDERPLSEEIIYHLPHNQPKITREFGEYGIRKEHLIKSEAPQYVYDGNKPISIIYPTINNQSSTQFYDYTFDSCLNWIERKIRSLPEAPNATSIIEKRLISYYSTCTP